MSKVIEFKQLSPSLKWAAWGGWICLVSSVIGFLIGFFSY